MKPKENVHYWRNPNLQGVETCRVIGSKHAFPNHSHEDIFAIGLLEIGDVYCLGPGKSEQYQKSGEIVLINPGQIHSGVPRQEVPITYRMLYIDSRLMTEISQDIFEDTTHVPEFTRFVVQDKTLFTLLKLLSTLLTDSQGKLELDSIVVETISNLLTDYGRLAKQKRHPGKEHKAVRFAKEILANRLNEKISLDEVAKAAALSQYHFLRTFKQATGLSPHVYRTQHRLEVAKKMLKSGIPLTEIALETGFSDQSHFNNKFRQFTGATPYQYLANSSA